MSWNFVGGLRESSSTGISDTSFPGYSYRCECTHGLTIPKGALVVTTINYNGSDSIAPSNAEWHREIYEVDPGSQTCIFAMYWRIAGDNEPDDYTFGINTDTRWSVAVGVWAFEAPEARLVRSVVGNVSGTNLIYLASAPDGPYRKGHLSVVGMGKDNIGTGGGFVSATENYINVAGGNTNQATWVVQRVYTTEVEAADINGITVTTGGQVSDNTYSAELLFEEVYPAKRPHHVLGRTYKKIGSAAKPRSTTGLQVNWQNPITRRLAWCTPLTGPIGSMENGDIAPVGKELVHGWVPIANKETGTTVEVRNAEYTSAVPHLHGPCLNLFDNNDNSAEIGLTYIDNGDSVVRIPEGEIRPGPDVTMVTAFYARSVHPSGSRVWSRNVAGGGGDTLSLFIDDTDTFRWRINNNNLNLNVATDKGIGQVVYLAGRHSLIRTGDIRDIFSYRVTDDTFNDNATASQSTYGYAATDDVTIGYCGNNNNRTFDGEIYYVYIWNRILTQGEIWSIWRNPWQVLARTDSVTYHPIDHEQVWF